MLAITQENVLVSGIDADAAGDRLGPVGFIAAIAGNGDDIEADANRASLGIDHGQRKIAEDAAADAVAFRPGDDRLGHRQLAIRRDCDFGMVAADILFGSGRKPCRADKHNSEKKAANH